MTTAHATPAEKPAATTKLPQPLEHETAELEALHAGLVRHLTAWRDAHEAAIMRLGAVMARIDAAVDRIERAERTNR